MTKEPKVDLCFHVMGRTLPVNYGFTLYGPASGVLPVIYADDEVTLFDLNTIPN